MNVVKKVVSGLGGHHNAVSLVTELTSHLWNCPAVSVVSAVWDSESSESGGGNREITASGTTLTYVKSDFVVKALIAISKGTTYDQEGAKEVVSNGVKLKFEKQTGQVFSSLESVQYSDAPLTFLICSLP